MEIKNRQAWGVALVVFGVLLGNTLYEFVGKSINLVNCSMMLGALLIVDYNKLLKLKMPRLKKSLIPYSFQFYLLFIFIFFRHLSVTESWVSDLAYIVFAIFLITALASNPYYLNWGKILGPCFLLASMIVILIGLVLLKSGNVFNGRFRFSSGADPLQMGLGLTSCFAVFLVFESKNISVKLLKIVDMALLVVEEFAFSCRTAIFICAIMFLVYIVLKLQINWIKYKNLLEAIHGIIFRIAIMIFVFGMVYLYVPGIREVIDNMGSYMLKGVLTLYGNNSLGRDASALTRVYTQHKAWSIILNEKNILKVLFGHGYMTMYVDVPILQALLDFGIVGWGLYFYTVVVYPICATFNRTKLYMASKCDEYYNQYLIVILWSLTAIGKQLSSALPYGHDVYLGAILCWFLA